MIGFHTVLAGDRVALWNHRGEVDVVDGPRRLWLFRQRLQRLDQHRALAGEFLAIKHRDGREERLVGPAALWFDPVRHAEIKVERALMVDSNEAVIVYSPEGGGMRRRILRGPAQYVPQPGERLNEFSWHGADPQRPTRKIPRALRFYKLRVIPDQMYHDVDEARTADDALVTVKLMIFFELAEIETMLDRTHDPIADLVNAVGADIINFVGSRTFEAFKAEAEALNELAAYPQLAARSERIGYRVTKVVYRGYHASDALQAMHDHAIEARTQLKLEAETETQAQELADFKLARERERSELRHRLEVTEAEHRQALARMEEDQRLAAMRRAANQEVALQQAADHQRREHLEGMRALGVDLTRWLVAQYQQPDRLIRIDAPTATPQIQITEN